MVLIFFYIYNSKEFLIHSCENEKAEKYGDYLNFPDSHFDIWEKYYKRKYNVDFDYYPRGRVVYNIKENCYYIYHDRCIKNLDIILQYYKNKNYKICRDYHYQCKMCNRNYIE